MVLWAAALICKFRKIKDLKKKKKKRNKNCEIEIFAIRKSMGNQLTKSSEFSYCYTDCLNN